MSLESQISTPANNAAVIKYSRPLTSAEKTTLEEWLPEYANLERVLGKKHEGFWEPKWLIFFQRHPLPPLTVQEIANGVDQGDRKGERIAHIKHVSGFNIFLKNKIETHRNTNREPKNGSIIIAAALLLEQVGVQYSTWSKVRMAEC